MKRQPLVRQQPATARASVPVKRCKACRNMFTPSSSWQTHCRAEACAIHAAELAKAKRQRQEAKEHRTKLEAIKPLAELRAEAQAAFNAYIRERDRQAGWGCICCGAPLEWHSDTPGGKVDAGHYMSRGTAPELAFDERNVNAQRKSCNRPGGATRAEFRAGMVARWGRQVVEELEGPREPLRLRHDDYRQIKADYRAKLRELKK